jgi:hypothetical protein
MPWSMMGGFPDREDGRHTIGRATRRMQVVSLASGGFHAVHIFGGRIWCILKASFGAAWARDAVACRRWNTVTGHCSSRVRRTNGLSVAFQVVRFS